VKDPAYSLICTCNICRGRADWPLSNAESRHKRHAAIGRWGVRLVALIVLAFLITAPFRMHASWAWQADCEANGGRLEFGRDITLCIKDGLIVKSR